MTMFTSISPEWIGTSVGLLGLIVGIFTSVRAKQKAKLSAMLFQTTVLSPQHDKMPKEVRVFYKDEEINQLFKTNIILWNDGTKTVEGRSIVADHPIRMSFEEDSTILRYQIVKETRDVNKVRLNPVENDNNAINIDFDFLDTKDGVNIEILHNKKHYPIITGVIRGMPLGIQTTKNPFKDIFSSHTTFFGFSRLIVANALAFFIGAIFITLGVWKA